MVAVVVSRQSAGRVLMAQRPATGMFAGLWEPPMATGSGAAARDTLLLSLGFRREFEVQLRGRLQHRLTHRRLMVEVHALGVGGSPARRPAPAPAPYRRLCWADPRRLAISTLARRVLASAGAAEEDGS